MYVRKIKLKDFHKAFKDAGIGKRYLHVYPDGLVRVKLDKTSPFKYIYI